jgi:hypothetical protein
MSNAPATRTHTDAEITRALLAEVVLIADADDWQLACKHTGPTETNSEGWTRCLVCGFLAIGW